MPIPASHIVEVFPRVITGGSNDLELNGLLLTKNNLISADTMALAFPSTAAVGAYFGIDSIEYQLADVYFTGYTNKFSAPRQFLISNRIDAAAPAWLRSGTNSKTLAAYQAIADGAFIVSVGGTAIELEELNFSTATSFSDIAGIITTGLGAAATCAYSSLTRAFTITSASTGAAATITYGTASTAGTDLSTFMGWTEALGAVISQGRDVMTVDEQMVAILDASQNWVTFTTSWEPTVDEALELADWASAHYGWLYVAYSTEPVMILPDSTADMASAIKTALYDHTAVVYGSADYAAFIMGVVASIAWQRVNGTITAAFKRQPGLAPWVVDELTASILEAKKCNYLGNFATRNAQFIFLYPGCLSSSDYGYIDPYINSIWLNNRIQVALMDGLTQTGRVPYNMRGYTMIKAWMQDPINQALYNACIEPGVVLNERQKTEVFNEAGLDISEELWTTGFYIQVLDPGPEIRAQRGSPIVSIWYTYGGAVQRIEVASTAIL